MTYIALFRGINVGGKHIVKMADLRQLLSDIGLSSAATYIQSGNVVFTSDLSESELVTHIESAFSTCFGLESNVMIRTKEELNAVIENLPFSAEEITAAEAADPKTAHVYVYFLNSAPDKQIVESLNNDIDSPDKIIAGKREIYLLCYQSIRLSKLAIKMNKLFSSATVRNWKTTIKLLSMV